MDALRLLEVLFRGMENGMVDRGGAKIGGGFVRGPAVGADMFEQEDGGGGSLLLLGCVRDGLDVDSGTLVAQPLDSSSFLNVISLRFFFVWISSKTLPFGKYGGRVASLVRQGGG